MENLNKVAQITLLFWLMKIVATTLGETFGDVAGLSYLQGACMTGGVILIVILLPYVPGSTKSSFSGWPSYLQDRSELHSVIF